MSMLSCQIPPVRHTLASLNVRYTLCDIRALSEITYHVPREGARVYVT